MSTKFYNKHFKHYNKALGQFSYQSFVYLATNYILYRQNREGNIVLKSIFDVAEAHSFDREEAKRFWKKAVRNKVFQEYEGAISLSEELSCTHKELKEVKEVKEPKKLKEDLLRTVTSSSDVDCDIIDWEGDVGSWVIGD